MPGDSRLLPLYPPSNGVVDVLFFSCTQGKLLRSRLDFNILERGFRVIKVVILDKLITVNNLPSGGRTRRWSGTGFPLCLKCFYRHSVFAGGNPRIIPIGYQFYFSLRVGRSCVKPDLRQNRIR